jgi:Scramblase
MLQFHRPFSWHSGQTRIYDPIEHASPHPSSIPSAANESEPSARTSTVPLSNMRIIGETNMEWATLHRKYNLFLFHMPTGETNAPISTAALDLSAAQHAQVGAQASDTDPGQYVQFAYIDSHPRLHEFALRSSSHQLIGHIDHTRSGFLRDLLNAGSYTLSMDAAESRAGASQSSRANMAYQRVVGGQKGEMGLTLDQRAVMLATAVAIDNDYYSPYSSRDDSLTLAGGEDFKAKAAPKKALKAEDTTGRVLGEPAKHQPDRALDPLLLAYAFAPPTSEIKSRQLPPPMDGTSSQDPWGQWPTGPDGWGGQPERAGTSEPVWDQNGKDPWSGQASQTGGDGKVRPGSSGVGEGGAAPEVPDGFFDLL